jgi:copper chaperone
MGSVKIKGMSCQHCVMAVTKALREIEGLEAVEVNLEKNEATYREAKPVAPAVIAEKIKKAGYEVVA